MATKQAIYPRLKVRLRFIANRGRRCTSAQMLKGILPALWEESDRQAVVASIGEFASLFNDNRVFFYPFPVDLYRTRFLDRDVGGYQHFAWETPDEDIHPLCENCRDWDFGKTLAPVQPFLMQGQAHVFLCPQCHNIVVDDYAAGKAGMISWLTKKQFKERFGVDAPEI